MKDSTPLDPLVGTTFGDRYYIENLLGTGGMGSVYLALDAKNKDERIAIKILHSSLSRDERHVKRFLREVQLTRKISHPNVVRIFDVGQQRGQLFFSMEYVEGISLKERLQQTRLSIDQILELLQQICSGLEAIHNVGIIHRDLKPANILMTRDDSAKIADLGVAKPLDRDLVRSNEVVGSAGYMCPELWRCEEVDATSDIYSLGVMLYEMVTGVRPFDGHTSTEVMNHHIYDTPRAPISDILEIPTWLTALILMMLEKEPLKRPQSANEIESIIMSATHGTVRMVAPAEDSPKREEKAVDEVRKGQKGSKVKPGILDRSPLTSTSNRMKTASKSGRSKKREERGISASALVPDVPNPAGGLTVGVVAAIAIFFLLTGPSTVLFNKFAGIQPVDALSLQSLLGVYGLLALGASFLLSIPILIFAAATASFHAQGLSYFKVACLTFVFIICLGFVHLGDFMITTGVKFAALKPEQLADVVNAAITNMVEGAFLMPLPTAFEPQLGYPATRLSSVIGQNSLLEFKFVLGMILYFTPIAMILKRQKIAYKVVLSRVNFYSVYGFAVAVSVLGNALRSSIIPHLPFDGTALVYLTSGYFTMKVDGYSMLWAGIAWFLTFVAFFISLGRAYSAALRDRVLHFRKLHQGTDPSKEIIGRR